MLSMQIDVTVTDAGRLQQPVKGMAKAVLVIVVAAIVAVGSLRVEEPSSAAFADDTGNGSASATADVLNRPESPAAVRAGTNNNLSWTPSVDAYADGYEIWRAGSSSGSFGLHDTVAGGATSAYSDDLCPGAVCNPVYVDAGTGFNGNAGSADLALPAGTEPGDLLFAVVAVAFQFPQTYSAPTGWTTLIARTDAFISLMVFYRVADGTESGTATFSWGNPRNATAAILRFTTTSLGTPWDAASVTAVLNDADPDAPSLTTNTDDTLVLRILTLNDRALSGAPAGHTERYYTAPSGFPTLSVADVAQPTAGATGVATWTKPGNDSYIAATVSLRAISQSTVYYRIRTTAGTWRSSESLTASS
jgi:hypothetical protein